jgi:hypothetical protein
MSGTEARLPQSQRMCSRFAVCNQHIKLGSIAMPQIGTRIVTVTQDVLEMFAGMLAAATNSYIPSTWTVHTPYVCLSTLCCCTARQSEWPQYHPTNPGDAVPAAC